MQHRYRPAPAPSVAFAPRGAAYAKPSIAQLLQRPSGFSKKGRDMKKSLIVVIALCGVLIANSADAGNGKPINAGSADTLTLAVYGDWPYNTLLLNAAPLLVDSINSDPK